MVTLRDVATRAGVSASTVSYVLRGDARFQPDTVARVRRAAEELGYAANLSARILKAGRNGVIGVAVYGLSICQPMRLAAALTREAGERGLNTIVQQTVNSREGELRSLEQVTSQFCDGLIFSPSSVSPAEIKAHVGTKPMVWCEDFAAEPLFDAVVTPSFEGAQVAVRHLLDVGCRRIAVLGANPPKSGLADSGNTAFCDRRLAGCGSALAEAGFSLPSTSIIPCPWDYEAARLAARRLADARLDTAIDGLFCMNDAVAMGAVRGFADRGIRVPEDVAIIGFDGIAETAYTVPSISTIAIDYDDYARKALDLLVERIDHPAAAGAVGATDSAERDAPRRLVADFTLMRRESTARR
ncbi:LacI family DNA-binding transcriptional regulator [Bifidobacterium eulemuris]|uniref:LacI family DNA-binding transcriptional regulator n=1 Tax=Bifidobacterium eulemuris TaxID=1765219 RepID=A0A261GDI1_9BIFI|nr:LacI family DNA-binding transcriptional regulator [Bifidobacterium eulemuris]OZG69470.1 Periplasmic binding protein-like domain-containing protein [Bifidobacterium eulemuris]QOL32169.1 LacI family DNA-binding transcriptional regulator [Bifidobacterium eulemuris]